MKISSHLPALGNVETLSKPRSPSATATAPAATGEAVEISPLSARLSDVSEAPFDAARVAEIKQAIAEGRFAVSAEKIADGLILSVRDLLARQSSR